MWLVKVGGFPPKQSGNTQRGLAPQRLFTQGTVFRQIKRITMVTILILDVLRDNIVEKQ